MRVIRSLTVAALLLGTGVACRSVAAVDREQLTLVLGRDPVELLRTIGGAPAAGRAAELARELHGLWSGADTLRLLRFGLAHDDERVVFGATILMGDQLPVPELRDAAAVVLPRLGDPDCPVTWEQARQLIGGVDFAAVAAVVPKLPEQEASRFLGHLHRMVRPDAIPVLCALARSTEGAVRRAAFGDAILTAEYSQQHVPLLVATWLDLVGRAPDPERVGPGLPSVLSAALRAHLELPVEPTPAEGQLDRRLPRPVVPCARWLVASTPSPADVPLLRALSTWAEFGDAALWTLGGIDDASAREIVAEPVDGVSVFARIAARARSGDARALDELLAARDEGLAFGLALASPERRREWFASMLALPFEQIQPILWVLGKWADNDLFCSFVEPPYDDRYCRELESALAASPQVDVRVLRGFVHRVPACETTRLADALLARRTDELFAPENADGRAFFGRNGTIGHRGVWPFLEVTRPDVLRRRLREGIDSDVDPVRDLCASLLIRLGDTERLDDLVAWIDGSEDVDGDEWWHLAQDDDASVEAIVRRRLAALQDPRDALPLMRALAGMLGMPRQLAQTWAFPEARFAAAREALLAGDPQAAFLRSAPEFNEWSSAWAARWRAPDVQAWARRQRDTTLDTANQVYLFDQLWASASDDHEALETMLGPVRDGRYATHYGFSPFVAAHTEGLAMLPFWIDDLASNCCRVAVVEDVLHEIFQQDHRVYERSRWLEPGSAFLRRTLLPVADRLRWSRIANGYVVAGR